MFGQISQHLSGIHILQLKNVTLYIFTKKFLSLSIHSVFFSQINMIQAPIVHAFSMKPFFPSSPIKSHPDTLFPIA